jgi:hypothetical protein
MKHFRSRRALKFLALATLAVGVFGFGVMWLWNAVMPPLTGWHTLGFWQAVALLVLCRILFGGLHGRGGGWHWRHRIREKMEQMSPEERERFHQALHRRCAFAEPRTEGLGSAATPE